MCLWDSLLSSSGCFWSFCRFCTCSLGRRRSSQTGVCACVCASVCFYVHVCVLWPWSDLLRGACEVNTLKRGFFSLEHHGCRANFPSDDSEVTFRWMQGNIAACDMQTVVHSDALSARHHAPKATACILFGLIKVFGGYIWLSVNSSCLWVRTPHTESHLKVFKFAVQAFSWQTDMH